MSDADLAGNAPLLDLPPKATPAACLLPETLGRWAMQVGRLLYTHNPFYVISACLVFTGLRISFPASSNSLNVWSLTLCLMAYTVLLSLTAVLVIRIGKVWDDARSLLLLVVLMLLGISVTFDRILADSPEQAPRYYVLGWVFAAVVSELSLRLLRLRLGALYRVPYHLLLALFFLYPLLPAPRIGSPHDPILVWQLFAFSSVAALVFLTLIPAVRRGSAYVADNGSPWPWPWFPWMLFGLLGVCVAFRSYSLCVSLHFVASSNIFAPYFLVPLGLAGAQLMLEAGLVAGSRRVVRDALCLPLPLLGLASFGQGSGAVHQGFLAQFVDAFGATPTVVTLWLLAGFFALAAVRRVTQANYPLIVTLVALSVDNVNPRAIELDALPLAVAGAWQIALGLRRSRSADVVVGSCLALAATAVAGRETWFAAMHGIVPWHLLLGILLGAGYWYRDRTGLVARRSAIALAALLATIATLDDSLTARNVPETARMFYPLFVASLLAGYGYATRDAWSYFGAAVAAGFGGSAYLVRLYAFLSRHVAGINALVLGALTFLIAALISLVKAGVRPVWMRRKSRG